MRSRFVHQAPPGASVTFGMSQAISEKLPVYVESRGDVQHQNPMTVPPSGQIVCYLDAEKAYDVKIIGLDGTIQILEDPAVEPVAVNLDPLKKDIEALKNRKPEQAECRCRALEFDSLKESQDALADKQGDVLAALKGVQDAQGALRERVDSTQPYDDASLRQQLTELGELVAKLTERIEALEGHNTETFEEFLRSERDGRDSDAETLESLREEIQMLMNRTQSADATQIEHDRYAELTCWESEILRG